MIEFARGPRPAEPEPVESAPSVETPVQQSAAPVSLPRAIAAASGATLQRSAGPVPAAGISRDVRRSVRRELADGHDGLDLQPNSAAAAGWLDDADTFNGPVNGSWRKVFKSDEFKAVRTALREVAGVGTEPNDVLYTRRTKLQDLTAAINRWDAKASATSSRYPAMFALAAEAREHLEFLDKVHHMEAQFKHGTIVAELDTALQNVAVVRGHRLSGRACYSDVVATVLASEDAGRARRDDAHDADVARAALLAREFAKPSFAALNADPTVDDVFRAYCAYMRGEGLTYAPTGAGVDVFAAGGASPDCSSVAKGLAEALLHYGHAAKRVDCGSSNFLTAAVPTNGSMPGQANITDATPDRDFPGRRYHFKTHYVTQASGQLYCGVIGRTWTDDCVAHKPTVGPKGYELVESDVLTAAGPATLSQVYRDTDYGIARVGDASYLVRVEPSAQ